MCYAAYAASLKYSEANDPVYNQLCQPIHENLLGPNSQIHEERVGGDTIKGILHDILLSGDGADNYTRGASDINVQDKFVFFDNPTFQGNASAKARLRALRSRGKRSQKHMSMRQHRQCGSFDFPRKYQRYDIFLPMHEMWKEYIGELLRNCRKKSIEQCLLAADFHGAILAVVESKNKSFIGVQGIMVRETVNTFGILTSENKFRDDSILTGSYEKLIGWCKEKLANKFDMKDIGTFNNRFFIQDKVAALTFKLLCL
jgi:ribonuclease P protein subunit POP4